MLTLLPVRYSTTRTSKISSFLLVDIIVVIQLAAHLRIIGELAAKFDKKPLSNDFVSFSNAKIPITLKTLVTKLDKLSWSISSLRPQITEIAFKRFAK